MTRRASVRKNVLAARGSFWEALPQVRMALAKKRLENDTTERLRTVACRTLLPKLTVGEQFRIPSQFCQVCTTSSFI